MFAIDGCKIRSDAAKEWSGTFKDLEQKRGKLKHLIRHYLQEHQFKDLSVVEPVFGNIGTNKGLNRFGLRGKAKAEGQWQLYCLVYNVEKLARYGGISR